MKNSLSVTGRLLWTSMSSFLIIDMQIILHVHKQYSWGVTYHNNIELNGTELSLVK